MNAVATESFLARPRWFTEISGGSKTAYLSYALTSCVVRGFRLFLRLLLSETLELVCFGEEVTQYEVDEESRDGAEARDNDR